MLKHYWITALRQIGQSRLFSAINIVGFTISIAAAFFIYLWVVDELSFDRFHRDAGEIYRVLSVNKSREGGILYNSRSVMGLSQLLRKDFPKIADATQIHHESKRSLQYGKNKLEGAISYVDGNFFSFFSFPVVEGDPARIGKEPGTIVITDKLARKLFGNESAVGKKVENIFYGRTRIFTVVAVVKVPRQSHIQFEIVSDNSEFMDQYYPTDRWSRQNTMVYLKKKPGMKFTGDDLAKMSKAVVDRGGNPDSRLDLQPLTDIHLHSDMLSVDPYRSEVERGDMKMVYLFITLAVIVIFMGAFNFMTLSTARASLRYKEIGVRKVCGSRRKLLIRQFISESVVQSLFAVILAIGLAELLLPYFHDLTGKDIRITFDWSIVSFVVFCIFGVGILAGSYPAFYLSSVNPLVALKGGTQTGKKGTLNKWLACVQFIFAITLMLCTAILFKQLRFIQQKDLGLDKENVVSVDCNLWYDVGNYKQEVLKNSHVLSVSMGAPLDNYAPGWKGSDIKWEIDGKADSLRMVSIWSDNDFVDTYRLKVLAGSVSKSNLGSYFNRTMKQTLVINETAWKQMGVENPVGLMTNWGEITGVVKDFHFRTLREQMAPAFLVYNPECLTCLHIKIAPDKKNETLRFLQEKYEQMNPGKVFEYTFFEDQLEKNYRSEKQQSQVLVVFTVVAISIAIMGVLGLVILTTRRRTKEIGVRKVNGAHTRDIVLMLCKQYFKWVFIAYAISCPLAGWLMNHWLQNFAYRTTMSGWIFVSVGVVTLLIALLSVGIQSYRIASQDPVKSLRYE